MVGAVVVGGVAAGCYYGITAYKAAQAAQAAAAAASAGGSGAGAGARAGRGTGTRASGAKRLADPIEAIPKERAGPPSSEKAPVEKKVDPSLNEPQAQGEGRAGQEPSQRDFAPAAAS